MFLRHSGNMVGGIRDGGWLNRERVTRAAIVGALLGAGLLVLLYATATGTLDAFGRPLGTDFSVFWSAGRIADQGMAPMAWNPGWLTSAMRSAHHSQAIEASAWLYPPVFLLAAALLAMLPYPIALLLFQLASLAAIAITLRLILRERFALLVALASPLTPLVLAGGQNALITAALLGSGLLMLGTRPLVAGALLGSLVYKPQLALLLLPLLLVTRSWKALAAAALSASVLVGASLILWGPEAWRAFVASVPLGRGFMETGAVGFYKSASLFAAMRMWGADLGLAYGMQALGLVLALALLWRLRASPPLVRGAGACAGVALSTPYLLDYELATVGVGAAMLFAQARRDGFLPWERSTLALIWIAPLFVRPIAQALLLPLGQATILLVAFLAWRRRDG